MARVQTNFTSGGHRHNAETAGQRRSASEAAATVVVDESEPVPDGSTADVLAWVDGDKDRARRALEKEQATETPRKGLSNELNDIINK